MSFTSLNHYLTLDLLHAAYNATRKGGAAGIDGQTATSYASNLEANLADLLERMKSGRYRAPAVRRVYIPKGDGSQRPLGIPTFEDKVAQRAVVMLLEPIYEQDFLNCSYGFRPGRSQHQALDALWTHIMRHRGYAVLDLDLRKFFDTLDHGHLREFLAKRVTDGVIRRLIDKWLKAGVLEGGEVRLTELGTPQGGVISPLLSNIYLHYVLDEWFETAVRPRMRGYCALVRFADDAVLVFERFEDCLRVREVLPKRMARFGLSVHPDKTHVVDFRPEPRYGGTHPAATATTFTFLGFLHHWVKTRKGNKAVRQVMAKERQARVLKRYNEWCKANRHRPLAEQQAALNLKLRGLYNYFARVGNSERLSAVWHRTKDIWRRALARRTRSGIIPWAAFHALLRRLPLLPPRMGLYGPASVSEPAT
jgi:group II intron reverse transcriptase/maturase